MLRIRGYFFEGSKPGRLLDPGGDLAAVEAGVADLLGRGEVEPGEELGVEVGQLAGAGRPGVGEVEVAGRLVGVRARRASFDPSGEAAKAATSRSPEVTGEALPVARSNDSRLARPSRATLSTRLEPSLDQAGRVGPEPRGGCWSPDEAAADVVIEVGRQVPRRALGGQVDDEQVGRGVRPDRLGQRPPEGDLAAVGAGRGGGDRPPGSRRRARPARPRPGRRRAPRGRAGGRARGRGSRRSRASGRRATRSGSDSSNGPEVSRLGAGLLVGRGRRRRRSKTCGCLNRPPARSAAKLPQARSICDSVQPPKTLPPALASAGMAIVRSCGPPGALGKLV